MNGLKQQPHSDLTTWPASEGFVLSHPRIFVNKFMVDMSLVTGDYKPTYIIIFIYLYNIYMI